MISLDSTPEGVILPVKAQPSSKRSQIRGVQNGALKVSVTQAPEKGKANKAIIDLLCKRLPLRKSQIELISGATSSQKRFLIKQIDAETLLSHLKKHLDQDNSSP